MNNRISKEPEKVGRIQRYYSENAQRRLDEALTSALTESDPMCVSDCLYLALGFYKNLNDAPKIKTCEHLIMNFFGSLDKELVRCAVTITKIFATKNQERCQKYSVNY